MDGSSESFSAYKKAAVPNKFSQKTKLGKRAVIVTPEMKDYMTKQDHKNSSTLSYKSEDFSDKFDTVVAVFVGDWHIGTPDFDLAGVIEALTYVLNTPNAVLFIMGDTLNTAILGAISNMFEDVAYPQEQWQIAVSLLYQVAQQGKLSVFHDGNHENRIDKQTGISVIGQATAALGVPEAHAPYYAVRNIVLKNKDCPDGKFEIPIVTHHGDGVQKFGDVKKLQDQDTESFINGVGHKHIYELLVRSYKFVNPKTSLLTRKDCLDVIFPSAGGGYYGDRKMYRSNFKSPYTAFEITSTRNPRYAKYKGSEVEELEFVPAYRSIPIMKIADTLEKNSYIKSARRIIKDSDKALKGEFLNKVNELLDWVEEQGGVIQEQVKKELKLQINSNYKAKTPILEKVTTKPKETKQVTKKDDGPVQNT